MSLGLVVLAAHAMAAAGVVGGQLLISVLAWRRPPDGDTHARVRIEIAYRRYALLVTVLSVAFGVWLLRFSAVSQAVIFSTPYGPALAIKGLCTLAFLAYLTAAPALLAAADDPRGTTTGRRRVWALVAAILATAPGVVGTLMRTL